MGDALLVAGVEILTVGTGVLGGWLIHRSIENYAHRPRD